MRVQFKAPFDYTPTEEPRVQLAYSDKGGANGDGVYTVRRECGETAVAAGKAEELDGERSVQGVVESRLDDAHPGVQASGSDLPPVKPKLSAAQQKALDRDNNGSAGGSLPKAKKSGDAEA
jgi:hypothetical protein